MELPESGSGSLAGVGARALARVSDFFVAVAFPNVVLGTLLVETAEDAQGNLEVVAVPSFLLVALVAILAAYEIGFVAWRGRTLGMLTGRLRLAAFDRAAGSLADGISEAALPGDPTRGGGVDDLSSLDAEQGSAAGDPAGGITPAMAVRRGLPAVLVYAAAMFFPIFGLAYVLLYLSPLLDPLYKQGWLDKLAGTVVVRS